MCWYTGGLDAQEMMRAFERFEAAAREDERVAEALRASAEAQRQTATRAQHAAEATLAADRAHEALTAFRGKKSVSARLGAAFTASDAKISQVVLTWGRDGQLDSDEWRQNILNLGESRPGLRPTTSPFSARDQA